MSRVIKAREIRVNPGLVVNAGLDTLDAVAAAAAAERMGRGRTCSPELASRPQSVIERAERHAKAMLEAAENESARIREEACAAGYEDGKAAAMSRVMEDARPLMEYLRDLAQGLANAAEETVRGAEDAVARLAIEVAEKILRQEVSTDGSIILQMVSEALGKANAKGQARLRVSAWDLDRIRDFREDLLRLADDVTGIEIVEDPRVEPGGCIVETDFGCVDARLTAQLREVGRAFFGNGDGGSR